MLLCLLDHPIKVILISLRMSDIMHGKYTVATLVKISFWSLEEMPGFDKKNQVFLIMLNGGNPNMTRSYLSLLYICCLLCKCFEND